MTPASPDTGGPDTGEPSRFLLAGKHTFRATGIIAFRGLTDE